MRKFILLTGLAFGLANLGTAQSVTYDYTGTVTESDGIFASVAVGSPVTGTYTFDFANANALQSTGTVGSSTQFWDAANYTEAGRNAPPVTLVFSSTAEVDGVPFVTRANVSYEDSHVSGGADLGGPIFVGEELGTLSRSVSQASELTLQGNAPPWSGTGLPLLNQANVLAFGTFEDGIGPHESVVGFNINSLTRAARAPEINASSMASALTLLLGGIAAFRKRPAAPLEPLKLPYRVRA